MTFNVRELLDPYLIKEVLKDEWLLRLDPGSADILLRSAVKDGKSYRKANGEPYWSKISSYFENRHIDGTRVKSYARMMITPDVDGTEWKDRITDIGVSPDGVLAMGFHTCLAVISSGTSHEVRLLSNFTETERNVEGTGRKQDFADVLYRYGTPNSRSTASLMQMICNHRRTLSPLNSITAGGLRNTSTELMALLDSPEYPLIRDSVVYGKRIAKLFYSTQGKYRKRSAVAPATVAHLYLEWMQQHPGEAYVFFHGLDTGENISGPVLLLRERLSMIAGGLGSPLDGVLNPYVRTASLMGIAWNQHLRGIAQSKLQLSNPPAPVWCEAHRP